MLDKPRDRNKVYVIEWRHSVGRWMPIWADQTAKHAFSRKRRYAAESPREKFRIKRYYPEEELRDAKP
jgi:hypothetical protein